MNENTYESISIDEEELWSKSGLYQRYWAHHKEVSTWFKQYIKDYKTSQYHSNYPSTMLPPHYGHYGNPYQQKNNPWMMQHQYYNGCYRYPSHAMHSHSQQAEGHMIDDTEEPNAMNFDISESSSDDSFEMEISDELRNFFAVSAKFKEERRKSRETKDLEDNSAHTGRKLKRSSAPPTERPGQQRLKEMQELYGKNAAMIHGMETALQLQFDRACDKKQPSHWPVIPLNV